MAEQKCGRVWSGCGGIMTTDGMDDDKRTSRDWTDGTDDENGQTTTDVGRTTDGRRTDEKSRPSLQSLDPSTTLSASSLPSRPCWLFSPVRHHFSAVLFCPF